MNRWHTIKLHDYLEKRKPERNLKPKEQGFVSYNRRCVWQSIYHRSNMGPLKKRITTHRLYYEKCNKALVQSCQKLLFELSSSPSYAYAFMQPAYSEAIEALFDKYNVPHLDNLIEYSYALSCDCGARPSFCDHDRNSLLDIASILEVKPLTFFNFLGLTDSDISTAIQGRFRAVLLPKETLVRPLPTPDIPCIVTWDALPLPALSKDLSSAFEMPSVMMPNPSFISGSKMKIGVELYVSARKLRKITIEVAQVFEIIKRILDDKTSDYKVSMIRTNNTQDAYIAFYVQSLIHMNHSQFCALKFDEKTQTFYLVFDKNTFVPTEFLLQSPQDVYLHTDLIIEYTQKAMAKIHRPNY